MYAHDGPIETGKVLLFCVLRFAFCVLQFPIPCLLDHEVRIRKQADRPVRRLHHGRDGAAGMEAGGIVGVGVRMSGRVTFSPDT